MSRNTFACSDFNPRQRHFHLSLNVQIVLPYTRPHLFLGPSPALQPPQPRLFSHSSHHHLIHYTVDLWTVNIIFFCTGMQPLRMGESLFYSLLCPCAKKHNGLNHSWNTFIPIPYKSGGIYSKHFLTFHQNPLNAAKYFVRLHGGH